MVESDEFLLLEDDDDDDDDDDDVNLICTRKHRSQHRIS